MTEPTEASSPAVAPPLALRVAAALCVVVAVVSAIGLISIENELAHRPNAPLLPLVLNPAVVLSVFAAAVLLWKRRKLGGYLLVAAAILPNLMNLAYGQSLRAPGLIMVLALITVAMNWQLLR